MIKADKHYTDKDYLKIVEDLENQFGSIKVENSDLKEKIRKLKVI